MRVDSIPHPRRFCVCRSCTLPASWALEHIRPISILKRDGSVLRGHHPELVFYCDYCIERLPA